MSEQPSPGPEHIPPLPTPDSLFENGDKAAQAMDAYGMSDAKGQSEVGEHPEGRYSWIITTNPFRLEEGRLVRLRTGVVSQPDVETSASSKAGEFAIDELKNQEGGFVQIVAIEKDFGNSATIKDKREDSREPILSFVQRVIDAANAEVPPK